jgi:hypothetical protein
MNRDRVVRLALLSAAAALITAWSSGAEPQAPDARTLRSPNAFESITDRRERSLVLYAEASRVLMHPRCGIVVRTRAMTRIPIRPRC